MSLELCRVVLIGTHYPGNLGSAARVLGNLGLRELTLVAPIADPLDPRALQMTARAEPILRGARIVADLGDAVADCTLVAATSARGGGLIRQSAPPEEVMPALAEVLQRGERAALVFGPEPSGLTNEQVSRCHHLIHIPTDAAMPALNLAQAVAICLYELRRAWLRAGPAPNSTAADVAPASFAEQEHLFGQLRTALEEIHFLYGPKTEPLLHALRRLLGRARLTRMEVNILRGLARQIRWYVANHSRDRD